MSLTELIVALSECGLKRSYAKVFVFLAKEGPNEVRFLAKALRMRETEVASCIKNLERQGMVRRIGEVLPEQFFAVPFEKALDILTEANLKEAAVAEKNKETILRYWDSMFKQ
jgi:DNA-binding Lrp family transcriptional regulator